MEEEVSTTYRREDLDRLACDAVRGTHGNGYAVTWTIRVCGSGTTLVAHGAHRRNGDIQEITVAI